MIKKRKGMINNSNGIQLKWEQKMLFFIVMVYEITEMQKVFQLKFSDRTAQFVREKESHAVTNKKANND